MARQCSAVPALALAAALLALTLAVSLPASSAADAKPKPGPTTTTAAVGVTTAAKLPKPGALVRRIFKRPSKAASASCSKSTISGYTSSIDLSENGLILHWKVATGTQLDLAIEAKPGTPVVDGWFSVAFSPDGTMPGSDAVVAGITGGALAGGAADTYSIGGYDAAQVTATTAFSVGTATYTATSGRKLLTFSRSTGDGGSVAVDVAGSHFILWAHSNGASSSIDYHGSGNAGSQQVDFTCDGTKPPPTCLKSTIDGYKYQAKLGSSDFMLHWKITSDTTIQMAMEGKAGTAAGKGWMSLGWSPSLKMSPADAVIGNKAGGPAVSAHRIVGKDSEDIKDGPFAIGNAGVRTLDNGNTLVEFTRTQGDGIVKVKGVNGLIWAHSLVGSKALGYHAGNRGKVVLDFTCTHSACSKLWWQFLKKC